MAAVLQHKDVPKGDIHTTVNWEFNTEADRIAFTEVTQKDVDKIAKVIDDGAGHNSYYILSAVNPLTGARTWSSIFGGATTGSTNLAVGTITTTTVQVTSDTGTDATLPAATNAAAGVATAAQIAKLEGISSSATANSSDAYLLDRSHHSGTQTVATLSDFAEGVQDTVAAALVAGTNITLTYNDPAGTITIDSAGSGGGGSAGVSADSIRVVKDNGGASPSGTPGKVTFNTVSFDTNTLWDSTNKRIIPKKAGYYLVSARVGLAAVSSNVTFLYKNGAQYSVLGTVTASDYGGGQTDLVYCNGTTDYLEIFFISGGQNYGGAGEAVYFSAIGPIQGAGTIGGGGATNLSVSNITATSLDILSDTGTDATLTAATGSNAGLMVSADFTKLAGVAAGATANLSNSALLDRTNHTGTQLSGTISDIVEAVQDIVGAYTSGTGLITVTYTDASNTLVISTTATTNDTDANLKNRANHTGTQVASTISDFTEAAQDATAAMLTAGTNITLTYNDAGNALTIDANVAADAIAYSLIFG
jgi:hypothetical protein